MTTLINDIKYSIRQLTNSPGFNLTVVAILTLGIGANAAIFSVIHAVLLKPLPFKEPEYLVKIWQTNVESDDLRFPVAYPNIEDWRRECPAFTGIAALYPNTKTIKIGSLLVDIDSACVSANLCNLLGIRPILGRSFSTEEENQRLNDRVLLTQDFWQKHCHANPDIIGKTIPLDETSYTVIGVLPDIPFPHEILGKAQVWTLITEQADDFTERGVHTFQTVARLNPDISLEAAQVQLDTVAARSAQEYGPNRKMGARVVSLHQDLVRNVQGALWVLLGAVGLVFLIAGTNTSNLMLIRASIRTQEFAIRTALGASRVRLVGQALVESLILSLISCLAALLVAHIAIDVFKAVAPANIPRLEEVAIRGPVIAFALVLGCATTIIVGLMPMLGPSVSKAYETLKSSSRGMIDRRHNRLRTSLVTGQIAVSMVLLVGSALLLRSFWDLIHVDPGYKSDGVLTWQMVLPGTTQKVQGKIRQLIEDTQALPGVHHTGATLNLPLFGEPTGACIKRQTGPVSLRDKGLSVVYTAVTPGYFTSMGIALLRGRLLTEQDTLDKTGSIIINESLARKYFPGEDPLGQLVKTTLSINQDNPENYRIVGIVADTRQVGFDQPSLPEIFIPYTQQTSNYMVFTARVQGNPLTYINAILNVAGKVDRNILVYEFKAMKQWQAESVADRRFVMILISLFAAMALGLTILGVYGVIAYAAAQRTHEMGIRIALGADKTNITALILKNGIRIAIVGITVGTVAALLICRFLQAMLFSVTATDPLTYVGVAILLLGAALLACYIPARRAAKIDPMEALRYE